MVVRVKDLMKGDEILIPYFGTFIYARVVRDVGISYHLAKDADGNKVPRTIKDKWGNTRIRYKKVWCTVNAVEHPPVKTLLPLGYYTTNKPGWTEYLPTGEGHNLTRDFDLNKFKLWLLTEREIQ